LWPVLLQALCVSTLPQSTCELSQHQSQSSVPALDESTLAGFATGLDKVLTSF
jgi:hypothetical protein